MLKFALSAVILGLSASAALADAAAINAGELKWGPAPPTLPKGAQAAVVSGDPGGKDLYVVRCGCHNCDPGPQPPNRGICDGVVGNIAYRHG